MHNGEMGSVMGFAANFIRFLAVQKFWKSVKFFLQNYREFKVGENWLRFDKVTDSLKVGTFLRHSVFIFSLDYSWFHPPGDYGLEQSLTYCHCALMFIASRQVVCVYDETNLV